MTEQHNRKQSGDKALSRRKFLTKAGVVAPVVVTLTSKPAFGKVCNISGFASASPANVSGTARHQVQGCGGFSHGAWKKPDHGNGNGDGNRSHWYATGVAPDPRDGADPSNSKSVPGVPIGADPDVESEDPPATEFREVFTHMMNDVRTFEEVVSANGSFDQFAAQTFLNAVYFGWGSDPDKISPVDVIELHKAEVYMWTSVTLPSSGKTVSLVGVDIKAFFENTQH